jgi:hypothetical protein
MPATTSFDSGPVVMAGPVVTAGAALTVMTSATDVLPAPLMAVTTYVAVGVAASGVPEMTPVAGSIASPLGSDGVTDQLSAAPPCTLGVSGVMPAPTLYVAGFVEYANPLGGTSGAGVPEPPPEHATNITIATAPSCCCKESPQMTDSEAVPSTLTLLCQGVGAEGRCAGVFSVVDCARKWIGYSSPHRASLRQATRPKGARSKSSIATGPSINTSQYRRVSLSRCSGRVPLRVEFETAAASG